jgi:hypothetical protein
MALFVTSWAEVSHFMVVTSNTECSGKTGVAFGKLFDVLI